MATFIDISSAFDKLNPGKAIQALIEKGVPLEIAKWYKDYLTSRYLFVEIKGSSIWKEIGIGCPQGGVLSTLLWNIAFDDLLNLFDENSEVTAVGYVDDGSLLITGSNLKAMYTTMNHALEKCQKWAEHFGLELSAEKTEYMLCTNKQRKSYSIPDTGIKVKGATIERVTSVKYLGLTIDHRLLWHEHITNKIAADRKIWHKLRCFIGKTWGPSPKLTKYAYTGSIRPILSNGAFALAHKLTKGQKQKLKSFQRQVLMQLGNFRKGTPGDALEVITDTAPLDLFMEAEMMKCNYRIRPHLDEDWSGFGTRTNQGHILKAKLQEDVLELPAMSRDEIDEPTWDKQYEVDMGFEGNDEHKGLRCYTDGSKTRTGSGAGTCIAIGSVILRSRAYPIPRHATVTQTEIKAITLACQDIRAVLDTREDIRRECPGVVILTDSRAALDALHMIDTRPRTVLEAKNLNDLAQDCQVTIRWVWGHSGILGNEIADRAAITGTKLRPHLLLPQTKTAIKTIINEMMYETWNKWRETTNCRQARLLFPSINRAKSKKIMELNKHNLEILVRNVTGHAHMDRHRRTLGEFGCSDAITPDFLNHISEGSTNIPAVTATNVHPQDEVDINLAVNFGICKLC